MSFPTDSKPHVHDSIAKFFQVISAAVMKYTGFKEMRNSESTQAGCVGRTYYKLKLCLELTGQQTTLYARDCSLRMSSARSRCCERRAQ